MTHSLSHHILWNFRENQQKKLEFWIGNLSLWLAIVHQKWEIQLKYLRHRQGIGGVSCVGPRELFGSPFNPNKLISDAVKRFVSAGLDTIWFDVIAFIESSSILYTKFTYAFACHTNKHVKIATIRLICLPDFILLFLQWKIPLSKI